MKRIVSKSKVTPRDTPEMDSVRYHKRTNERRDMDILYRAQRAWDGLYQMRINRDRLVKFTFGDQYSDKVEVDGKVMREDQYWAEQGVIAKKNNLINKMVRSVTGVYNNQDTEFMATARDRQEQRYGEMFTSLLQANWEGNRLNEVTNLLFKEFIISATVFLKESYGYRRGRKDTWTDTVSLNNMIFDGVLQDVRHWDVSLIGQIHDMSFGELCSKFCKSQEDITKMENIYTNARDEHFVSSYYSQIYRDGGNVKGSFFVPQNINLCRVIEIWNKEQKARYRCHDWATGETYKVEVKDIHVIQRTNQERRMAGAEMGMDPEDIALIDMEWFIDDYWYFRFLTPLGDVLQEGETPFNHMEHPYTMKLYPFINSQPYSLVEDAIDQQKFVNELITMYMLMAKHSAKGLLMFPEQLMPEDVSIEDIAEEYTKVNGMIVFKAKEGVPLPQQLSSNVSNFNITELLKIEMQMFEEVTGITGAMQGKTPASGTAAALYAQQTQNASNTLSDILESYGNFLKEAVLKKLSNIQQFYTEEEIMTIAGAKYKDIDKIMPHLAKSIELDVSISQGTSSPAYNAAMNEFLMQIWGAGQITLEQMLEVGRFQFGDELLQAMKVDSEEAQAEQQEMMIQ